MFKGNITALVTPFKDQGIDKVAYEKLVNWQIEEGVHGLVPCGTTGESPTLSSKEYQEVVEICVKATNKRVPVIAGAGSNSTEKTIYFSKIAEEAGVDALLLVSPYYNKPTQDGLYAHFKAVHDATKLPIILYDIPPRSIVEISVQTMARLAELPRIVGVKDATGNLEKPLQLRKYCGESFCLLSGDDGTSLAYLAQGGHGCISVVSNIVPKLCVQMQNAWIQGDVKLCQELNLKLQPLRESMFCETSPAPVKFGIELLGMGSCQTRLPLVPASSNARERVKECLNSLGILS